MEEEWEELWNEKHQRKYWKNKTTGEKSWKDPKRTITSSTSAAQGEGDEDKKEGTESAAEDWEELFNEKHQRKYWKNKKTGEKTWNRPAGMEAGSAVVSPPPPPPPPPVSTASVPPTAENAEQNTDSDWVEAFNEKHQRKYWKNTKTGEKSWTAPAKAQSTSESNAVPAAATSGDEWVEMFNEKHKRKYWKNKTTGANTWNNPHEPAKTKVPDAAESKGTSFVSQLSALSQDPAEQWDELFSEKHKRKYWKHKVSGQSTWTKPPELATAAATTAPAVPASEEKATIQPESEWTEMYSEKHKKKYWKNKVTGKTSWTPPAPPPPPPPATIPANVPSTPVPVEKASEVAQPKEEEKPKEIEKHFYYRSLTRIATLPNQQDATNLFLFELFGSMNDFTIVIHEIINEDLFLDKADDLLQLTASQMNFPEAVKDIRKLHLKNVKKIVSNEVNSCSFLIFLFSICF
jgi:hypothetical protein